MAPIIGFDAKRAFNNRTGLGNYSRILIEALCQFYPENQLVLFTPKISEPSIFPFAGKNPNVRIIAPPNKGGSFWRSFKVPSYFEKEQISLFHGLSNELPLAAKPKNTKYVVTIHDLIFLRYPELYNWIDRKIYRFKTKDACKKADLIIAISQQTKKDLVDFLKVPEDKIRVVYQEVHPIFQKEEDAGHTEKIKTKYRLPKNFLLQVGTIERRKNALLTLQALTLLPKEISVVFVGRKTDYQAELDDYIKKHDLQERVLFLNKVPNEELVPIFHAAKVFVYPSRFEGLGLPILEAIRCGLPVIGATGSCLEEVGGPEGLYVDPDDHKALAAIALKLLTDQPFRQRKVSAAENHAKQFSTENFAKDTMSVYRELI